MNREIHQERYEVRILKTSNCQRVRDMKCPMAGKVAGLRTDKTSQEEWARALWPGMYHLIYSIPEN